MKKAKRITAAVMAAAMCLLSLSAVPAAVTAETVVSAGTVDETAAEDSLNIREDIRERFRTYEVYSDSETKPELRLVSEPKRILKIYNASPIAFADNDNIDDILAGSVLSEYYIVDYYDRATEYYRIGEEGLIKLNSTDGLSSVIENKAIERLTDQDFVKKYISPDAKLLNVYYLSGKTSMTGTAIYFNTTAGEYVYYNGITSGEYLFRLADFCDYEKAMIDEAKENTDSNGTLNEDKWTFWKCQLKDYIRIVDRQKVTENKSYKQAYEALKQFAEQYPKFWIAEPEDSPEGKILVQFYWQDRNEAWPLVLEFIQSECIPIGFVTYEEVVNESEIVPDEELERVRDLLKQYADEHSDIRLVEQEEYTNSKNVVMARYRYKVVMEYESPDEDKVLPAVKAFMKENNIDEDIVFFFVIQIGKIDRDPPKALKRAYDLLKQYAARHPELRITVPEEFPEGNKVTVRYNKEDEAEVIPQIKEYMQEYYIYEEYVSFEEANGDVDAITSPTTTGSTVSDISVFTEGEIMKLDDVIELSKKGDALALNDLAKFKGDIAGAGIFILEYDLGNGYTLIIGSMTLEKIDFARLCHSSRENYIDIRTDDVEAFISSAPTMIIPSDAEPITTTTPSETGSDNTGGTATAEVNIASDEELTQWAINDYQEKTGITAASAEIRTVSDEEYEIVLKDADGNILDTYTIDPETGIGTNSSNEAVDLPQTGNNSTRSLLTAIGAILMIAFGAAAIMFSGVINRRKQNER